ncbi:hypothetical protein ACFXGI_05215 [Streptomyces sp. NPDC059355]|uniref:hypothetical protein n=1 Tax=Streptomyces sp. NPDC059355 TaxID=3346811 RepID=UPI003679D792
MRSFPSAGDRRGVVAVCAATAVAVTAAVAAVVVLSDDGGEAGPPASGSAGWKTVVNPLHGTAFDVPPGWEVMSSDVFSGFSDHVVPDKPVVGHTAPAFYKYTWCSVDSDGDGRIEDFALAGTGTKGGDGAKSTDEVARKTAAAWVYGAYTQPDKDAVTWDEPVEYTTRSGVRGSYVKAHSKGSRRTGKCAGEGRAIAFGFKNSKGDFVAWDLYGRTGVPGAVSDELIMRILSTVRLSGEPTG